MQGKGKRRYIPKHIAPPSPAQRFLINVLAGIVSGLITAAILAGLRMLL